MRSATTACLVALALVAALLSPAVAVSVKASQSCVIPPVSANYTNTAYEGFWYEIGRIQTIGGAVFQTGYLTSSPVPEKMKFYVQLIASSCECTALNVTTSPDPQYILQVANQCRRFSPTAPVTTVVGHLFNETYPGQFSETIISFEKPVRYNVVYVDENYAIEYDCGEALFSTINYCIHIMSRTPTMPSTTLTSLVSFAESLGAQSVATPHTIRDAFAGLNSHQLSIKLTPQTGCW